MMDDDYGLTPIETGPLLGGIPRGTDAEVWWRRFSGGRAIVWTVTIPLAVLFGWIDSVAFVAVCSLYANVASDVAAWRSDVNPQLDRIERRLVLIQGALGIEDVEEAA